MKIIVNEKEYEVEADQTILEACKKIGISIPHFCNYDNLPPLGACRICVVEIDGARSLTPSCATKVTDGVKIKTHSKRVVLARRNLLELILANHDMNCPICARNQNCKLQKLAAEFSILNLRYEGEKRFQEIDDSSPSFIRNYQKCILCEKCVRICKNVQDVHCIDFKNRGFKTEVGIPYNKTINETECTTCGQCVVNCPVGALYEKESIKEVIDAIESGKHVIAQTAPAVRVALGELFGMHLDTTVDGKILSTFKKIVGTPHEVNVQGKMVASLRKLGFSKVFDTSLGADFTIMEEANELMNRIKNGGTLPMFTSCCPAWVKYAEHNFPENLPHLSSCKSPHMMLGRIIKTYYAEKYGIKQEDLVVVSIMPCTAKKYEIKREEMSGDVDYVLTTRELGKMIKQVGINFTELADEEFDLPLGVGSGAGHIFAASGGVMEAALRTVYETETDKKLTKIEFDQIRGANKIKTGTIDINGKTVRFAVAHGLSNARKVMEEKNKYDFIEVMACPGGCIGGGGQPIPTNKRIIKQRMEAVYATDKNSTIRRSHENPYVKEVYKDFLEKPGSEKSHKLLHTKYVKRSL